MAAHGIRSSWTATWMMETLLASSTGMSCLKCSALITEGHSAAVIQFPSSPLAQVSALSARVCWLLLGCLGAALHCNAQLRGTLSCWTINAGPWTC